MKPFNSKDTVAGKQKAGGRSHLFFCLFRQNKFLIFYTLFFFISILFLPVIRMGDLLDNKALEEQQIALKEDMKKAVENEKEVMKEVKEEAEITMLPEYKALYEQNNDFIGWLSIEDTVIDYPVMQCEEDENFYLIRNFYQKENKNGCLILDNDSKAGVGTWEQRYVNGSKPSTNLIIHGHTIKTGQMFGGLQKYQNKEYGLAHNILCFDSLYEKRKYQLISVFYSQVYYQSQEVFKYYKFFQANTQKEFDDWYNNIKEMSLYDTGVTAQLGDEFITLSCCAYHVEDGRFVVVGKRIY